MTFFLLLKYSIVCVIIFSLHTKWLKLPVLNLNLMRNSTMHYETVEVKIYVFVCFPFTVAFIVLWPRYLFFRCSCGHLLSCLCFFHPCYSLVLVVLSYNYLLYVSYLFMGSLWFDVASYISTQLFSCCPVIFVLYFLMSLCIFIEKNEEDGLIWTLLLVSLNT